MEPFSDYTHLSQLNSFALSRMVLPKELFVDYVSLAILGTGDGVRCGRAQGAFCG